MPVELSPVEFMQLMDLSQRRVVLAGNDINQHGRPHKEMFLIVEGTAEVGAVGLWTYTPTYVCMWALFTHVMQHLSKSLSCKSFQWWFRAIACVRKAVAAAPTFLVVHVEEHTHPRKPAQASNAQSLLPMWSCSTPG